MALTGGELPFARQHLNALRTAPFDNTESALSGRGRHIEGHHGLGQPLQVECANFFESHHLLDRNSDALIDENLSILSLSAETGGEVAHRANRGVPGTVGKTDLAECRITLRDARAKAKFTTASSPSR